MNTKSKKKTRLIVLLSVIGVLAIAAAVIFVYDSSRRNSHPEEPESQNNHIQYFYGTVGCMHLMEKNKIPVNEQYKSKIKEKCEKMISTLDMNEVDLLRLSRLVVIDRYFKLGNYEKYLSDIDDFYDEERKLFSDEKISNNVEKVDFTEDDIIASEATASIDLYKTLAYFDISLKKYDLKEMIADFFDQNSSKFKTSDLDVEDKLLISSPILSAFYVFLEEDELNMIKYDKVWTDFKKKIESEQYEEYEKPTISELSDVDSTLKLNKLLNANRKTKYKSVQEYYELLKTKEEFEYSKDDEIFPIMTFSYLSVNNDLDLSKNTYFTENINQWLEESLKNQKL